jgi:hypothetical protein
MEIATGHVCVVKRRRHAGELAGPDTVGRLSTHQAYQAQALVQRRISDTDVSPRRPSTSAIRTTAPAYGSIQGKARLFNDLVLMKASAEAVCAVRPNATSD